ncbi:uncharacterized protein C8A04DRAFT_27571 [Dichotomopilus funicola]|uniref:Uncharacterized protein n=1 Tax=Dichotomopilus funicola TaxID=1934379 RepID=A0AAN6ZMD8_9PEZI|nr:hypothetical protein C8A04DRAFT_27571 [Dichotomopilus funicola]
MGDEAAKQEPKAGKGKAVTRPGEGDDAADLQASGTSLPQMVQSAASFLLSGPPAGSGLGASDEKGGSSRVGEALARAGESSVQLRSNLPAPGGATLRSGQAQDHIAQEEASFSAFLNSDNAPALTVPEEMQNAWQPAAPRSAIPAAERAEQPNSHSVAEQQARDGNDVVAMLSGDGDLEQVFAEVGAAPSPSDLANLREALFGEGAENRVPSSAWDNVLNFIPEYLRAAPTESIGPGDPVSQHLGTSNTGEAWESWLDQWSRVLTSYQDEVWGDLNALVEEARAEVQQIEEIKPGDKPIEPTALLRLRTILGHLRGP